jgi:two-component system, NarL family, response regulator DevR
MKVAVLCCNRLLGETITRILAKRPDFELVSSMSPTPPDINLFFFLKADVAVLDSLDALAGISFASFNNRNGSTPAKALLVAMEDNHDHFLTAVRRGVCGYVLRDASAADVLNAIRSVGQGEAVCPPSYARVLFDCIVDPSKMRTSAKRLRSVLTRREQQLLPLLSCGQTNKEIANKLHISEQTVKNHVHRMMRKTGASSRLDIGEVEQASTILASTESTLYGQSDRLTIVPEVP